MSQLNPSHLRQPFPAVLHTGEPQQVDAEGPFWCAAIGSGAAAVLALAPEIDRLSQRAAQLPLRASLTRPVVGQYLCMVKTLAAAWMLHNRPALVASLQALSHFADSVGQAGAGHGPIAPGALETLQRRLAAPLAAFEALGADFASYLAQMARVSGELDADTRLVTQRLQADQVHVFLLSQQATLLQAKLDQRGLREHACWLVGPPDQAVRQEHALHASALDGVRRQLEQLHAEQASTIAEADYLQGLLPTVAPYLAAVDQLGAGIDAIVAGARVLDTRLAGLARTLADDPAATAWQLAAAIPLWQALARDQASLQAN
jgi:hypothetical protein